MQDRDAHPAVISDLGLQQQSIIAAYRETRGGWTGLSAAAAAADTDIKTAEEVIKVAYSKGLVERCPDCGRYDKHYHAGCCILCAPPL